MKLLVLEVLTTSDFFLAAMASVLLLPVQHILPFMVSNVNSISTSSEMPTTILKRELDSCAKRIAEAIATGVWQEGRTMGL